jgi:outer membrane protein assembly factor BamA
VSKRLWPAAIGLLLSGLLSAQGTPSASKAHIGNIRFENTSRLSAQQKSQLVQELQDQDGQSALHTVAGPVEQAVLAAYADKGYWKARVKVEVVAADDVDDGKVRVSVRAIDQGSQYRLHQLRWSGVTAFSEKDLTPMVPIHPGHILERAKIAEGMEAVRRLYLAAGYLGYVAVPDVSIDDRQRTVDLQVNVEEGGVFTVRSFDVVGLDRALRERLLQSWPFKPGDVYRGENVENFLSVNASLLPLVTAADVVCRTVDLSNHTIDFLLDFRPQPLACNSAPEAEMTRQTLNRTTPAR